MTAKSRSDILVDEFNGINGVNGANGINGNHKINGVNEF